MHDEVPKFRFAFCVLVCLFHRLTFGQAFSVGTVRDERTHGLVHKVLDFCSLGEAIQVNAISNCLNLVVFRANWPKLPSVKPFHEEEESSRGLF